MPEQITEQDIRVRQVSHFQPTWTEGEPGAPGTFTVQLILDEGAEEYVIRPHVEDMEVLTALLAGGENVYFDMGRRVLMFGNKSVG